MAITTSLADIALAIFQTMLEFFGYAFDFILNLGKLGNISKEFS